MISISGTVSAGLYRSLFRYNILIEFSPSALYFWFSSNSIINGRASVMCSTLNKRKVGFWYVSFIRRKKWHVAKSCCINSDLVEQYFQPGVAEGKR